MADAGRVIAGSRARPPARRRPGEGTRPFGDRVKQTLFAILEPDLPGARVLDLFAGSGAAGIEALSRGAAHATFVERDAGAAAVIEANLARTHLAGERARSCARRRSAGSRGRRGGRAGPFDIAIVDPPYAEPVLADGSARGARLRCSPRAPGWSPSTSGATRRRPRSGC